jgi:hypothetical protein
MANKILTYEEFTGSKERTPEKIAAYAAYLNENKKKAWSTKA